MFAYNLTCTQQEKPKRLYGPFPLEIRTRGVFPVSPANDEARRSQKRSVRSMRLFMAQSAVNTGQKRFHHASGSLVVSDPLTVYHQLCQLVSWWSANFGKNSTHMHTRTRAHARVYACVCAYNFLLFSLTSDPA